MFHRQSESCREMTQTLLPCGGSARQELLLLTPPFTATEPQLKTIVLKVSHLEPPCRIIVSIKWLKINSTVCLGAALRWLSISFRLAVSLL